MAQKIWERFTPAEAKQMEKESPELFSKYYDRYKSRLYDRAKTFMKHERTKSHGYKMIVEALKIEAETGKNAYNLSKMSQILNSKWASYSNQRRIDKKIVATLNDEEHFGKGFISLKDLDDFGDIMDQVKEDKFAFIFGSDEQVKVAGEVIREAKENKRNWREVLAEYIANDKI